MPFTEATYEQAIIELFEQMGYTHLYAPELERDYESPLLDAVLLDSLARINKKLPPEAIQEAIGKLKSFEGGSLIEKNRVFMDYLQNGIEIKYFAKGRNVPPSFTCWTTKGRRTTRFRLSISLPT